MRVVEAVAAPPDDRLAGQNVRKRARIMRVNIYAG